MPLHHPNLLTSWHICSARTFRPSQDRDRFLLFLRCRERAQSQHFDFRPVPPPAAPSPHQDSRASFLAYRRPVRPSCSRIAGPPRPHSHPGAVATSRGWLICTPVNLPTISTTRRNGIQTARGTRWPSPLDVRLPELGPHCSSRKKAFIQGRFDFCKRCPEMRLSPFFHAHKDFFAQLLPISSNSCIAFRSLPRVFFSSHPFLSGENLSAKK